MVARNWVTGDRALILLAVLLVAGAGLGRIVNPGMLRPRAWTPQQAALPHCNFSPAPVVEPGPPIIDHGQRVPTWIVRGAGDDTFDGTYRPAGTFDCRPCYTNGHCWLFYFSPGKQWALNYDMRAPMPEFPYACREELPGKWSALQLE